MNVVLYIYTHTVKVTFFTKKHRNDKNEVFIHPYNEINFFIVYKEIMYYK